MHADDAEIAVDHLPERLEALPGIAAIRAAAGPEPVFLVGGAVRDLLLGRGRADLDVAVEGDPEPIARRLGGDARFHERFGTATVQANGIQVDLARTRAESYPAPGALPSVRAAPLREDLARRDFSVNAMAIPLAGSAELIDPHGGLSDLSARLLRVLHPGSFVDDPTRAIRAARYSARLGLSLEPETEGLLRAADLGAVSRERIEAELRRLAAEPEPIEALRVLLGWQSIDADPDLAGDALAVLERDSYAELADRASVLLAAAGVKAGRFEAPALDPARELAGAGPGTASALTELARGHTGAELVIARALGARWLDDYVSTWRHVRLEIGGADLVVAGVPEGPAVGHGLREALRAKLDGELEGREEELAAALVAASAA
jgi:tRNA nucleotidyltransferase (CCA-adding enzyme)